MTTIHSTMAKFLCTSALYFSLDTVSDAESLSKLPEEYAQVGVPVSCSALPFPLTDFMFDLSKARVSPAFLNDAELTDPQ